MAGINRPTALERGSSAHTLANERPALSCLLAQGANSNIWDRKSLCACFNVDGVDLW